jgi:hypothetical protein
MRASLFILRAFVFIAVAGVILAVWAALGAIQASPPALVGDEVSVSKADVGRIAGDVLNSRSQALDIVASGEESPRSTVGPTANPRLSDQSNLESARTAVQASLENRNPQVTETRIPPAPIIDPLLDQADALYWQGVSDLTGKTVGIYQDLIALEAPYYLRYIGFQALRATVDRDVISYRELNSLPLNDSKSTLYQTESDTNRDRLESLATDAATAIDKEKKAILTSRNALLDRLVAGAVANWTRGETGESGARPHAAFRSLFLDRLAAIGKQVFPPEYQLRRPPAQVPGAHMTSWLSGEEELTREFRTAGGSN